MTNIPELVGSTNQLAVDEFVARFRLSTRCIRHTSCLPCTTTDEWSSEGVYTLWVPRLVPKALSRHLLVESFQQARARAAMAVLNNTSGTAVAIRPDGI